MEMLRKAAAIAGAVCLVVALVRNLPVAEGIRRWQLLSSAPMSQRRLAGFWFEPAYLAFLDGVASNTHPEDRIAIDTPQLPMYLYAAVYALAPRRVVRIDRDADANVIAAFAAGPTVSGQGVRIANGWLRRQ